VNFNQNHCIPSRIGISILLVLCISAIAMNAFSQLKESGKRPNKSSEESFVDSTLAIPYDQLVADFSGSETKLRQVWALSSGNKWIDRQAKTAELLGIVMYLQGQYDSTAYYNMQSMELHRKAGNEAARANIMCSYGYQIKRINLQEAFRYMRTGIQELERLQDDHLLTGAYDNFGVLFEMRNDLDSALLFYNKALSLKELANDSIGLPFSLNKLGFAHILRHEPSLAKPYFDRAYEIRKSRNDIFGIIENMTFYGDYYYQTKELNEAITWFEKSNHLCDSLSYPYQKQYNLEQLSLCYEESGRYSDALIAERLAVQIGDSLLNEKNARAIIDLEKKYSLSEKNLQIAELDKIAAQRQVYIILAISALFIGLFFSLYRSQVIRRRAKAERDAALLAEKEAGIQAVFDATEEERKRIAKDLHDGIGQQMSGIKLSWEALRTRIAAQAPAELEVLSKISSVLDESAKEVRSISHQMMPRALQENGLLPAITDMLEKSLGLSNIKYVLEHYKVQDRRFDERVEVGVYRVCQELVNNIIKHSGATQVAVQLLVNKKYLLLIVEDNGKGFSSDKGNKGIGLLNMTSRINTVKGEITLEPSPESGTVATIRVPVS